MTTHRLSDLDAIRDASWHQLARCATDRAHAWRVMGLATVDAGLPDLRSVVIREVDVPARTLMFFTDARSPKVAQIAAQPRAVLLAWSASLGWQLRLQVHLVVETSGLAVSSRWAHMKLRPAAHDYLSPLPPGAPLPDADHPPALQRETRNHFAVVLATVQAMDWLELHGDGHRRACFDADGNGQWLVP